jgi:hypothetical protein
MKTPIEELFQFMEDKQYFIGDDLLAAFKEARTKEKRTLEKFYNHAIFAALDTGHGEGFEDYYQRIFK